MMITTLLFDVVLVHLLFEDIRDDRSKLLTLFFRQFSRVLCDCIQLRILIGDPLDGFRRCVFSHEEGDLLDPLLWDESKNLVSDLFITDLSGGKAGVDLFLFFICKIVEFHYFVIPLCINSDEHRVYGYFTVCPLASRFCWSM